MTLLSPCRLPQVLTDAVIVHVGTGTGSENSLSSEVLSGKRISGALRLTSCCREEDPVVLVKELSFGNPFFRRWWCLEPDPPIGSGWPEDSAAKTRRELSKVPG